METAISSVYLWNAASQEGGEGAVLQGNIGEVLKDGNIRASMSKLYSCASLSQDLYL